MIRIQENPAPHSTGASQLVYAHVAHVDGSHESPAAFSPACCNWVGSHMARSLLGIAGQIDELDAKEEEGEGMGQGESVVK